MRTFIARLFLAAGCGALALFSAPALCLYASPAIQNVPVARLIANLQAKVDKNPNDVRAVLNLARAHAIAYSLQVEKTYVPFSEFPDLPNVQILRDYPELTMPGSQSRRSDPPPTERGWSPAYGRAEPPGFDKIEKTTDPSQLQTARESLAQALAGYRRAAQLAPENLAVQLGLAWLTEQAGNKQQAVRLYRSIVAEAWKLEQRFIQGEGADYYITCEAGRYLIALLDPVKDKTEIDKIKAWTGKLESLPRRITPIAIPLAANRTVHELEDRSAAVTFDADGWGLRKSWTWITPQAVWLVYQPQPDRAIESALDWFGTVTFWLFWSNGYEALGALDDDHDGQLQAAELRGLALWHDANQNGVSESGEIQSLAAHGIVALSYDYRIDTEHPDHIAFAPDGVKFADGSTRPSYDLILHPAQPRLRL